MGPNVNDLNQKPIQRTENILGSLPVLKLPESYQSAVFDRLPSQKTVGTMKKYGLNFNPNDVKYSSIFQDEWLCRLMDKAGYGKEFEMYQ